MQVQSGKCRIDDFEMNKLCPYYRLHTKCVAWLWISTQAPTREELHAFLRQKEANASIRMIDGQKLELSFGMLDTVQESITKFAKSIGLKNAISFGIFISPLVSRILLALLHFSDRSLLLATYIPLFIPTVTCKHDSCVWNLAKQTFWLKFTLQIPIPVGVLGGQHFVCLFSLDSAQIYHALLFPSITGFHARLDPSGFLGLSDHM